MAKIKVWYKIGKKYSSKIVKKDLPVNEYGFILFKTLSEELAKDFAGSVILKYQIQ